eukprot:2019463-Amphidinium_carterae.1
MRSVILNGWRRNTAYNLFILRLECLPPPSPQSCAPFPLFGEVEEHPGVVCTFSFMGGLAGVWGRTS